MEYCNGMNCNSMIIKTSKKHRYSNNTLQILLPMIKIETVKQPSAITGINLVLLKTRLITVTEINII